MPIHLLTRAYWRIDEVNDAYSGTEPPPGPWKGAVWSFEATGKAYNVYPADESTGAPALNLVLRWEAGTDAGSHDVYLGSSYSAVRDANTNTSGIFRLNQAVSDVNYLVPEDLDVHEDYFWRIDEVNSTTGTFVKGDVWRFKTGAFLVVDSFDFYEDTAALRAVWKDVWYTAGNNGAKVFVETATDFVRSGQSMKYTYTNFGIGKPVVYYGSWAEADATDLEFASNDWTRGGVKALVIYFIGDPCNGKDTTWVDDPAGPDPPYCVDQMYIALEDGSTNEGVMKYDTEHGYDMNDIKEAIWHEWNVNLQDFNDAGVALTNVSKVYLGFGGPRVGQAADGAGMDYSYPDTVYFDDIRLYPPRCRPSVTGLDVLHGLGDFTEDCNTDYFDLDIMAGDWLMSGQWVEAQPPTFAPEVWYRFDDGLGKTVVKNDGWWGSQYDIVISSPNAPDEPKWTTSVAPALDPCDPNYALDFDGADDYLEIPNSPATNFAGTQNMTITTWVKGTPTAWSHLVCSATDDPRHATGLGFGGTTGDFMYFWNENEWWWDPGFVVSDNQWAFMAIAVEPTQATAYLYDGTTFKQAKNIVEHGPLEDFDTDCRTVIAQDAEDSGYFDGIMDDVRLYNKTLTAGEIMGIAGAEGFVYVPLDSDADLVVGDKDPCYPDVDDQIDFADYAALADNWLEQHLWP